MSPLRQAEARGLPSEAVLGFVLLLLGLTLAVVILSGAVQVGFAP